HAVQLSGDTGARRRPVVAAGAGAVSRHGWRRAHRLVNLVSALAANAKERLRGMSVGGALQHCKALTSSADRQGSPMLRQTTASWV
ncbi:hypothetical protein, partial [Xanthomonas oryzae]|uniref:hypothetical protein n=1 Tax=Xanthomonas oryzae TaxID=347 RepID=UPI001C66913E